MIENEPQKSTIDQRESAKQQSSNETEIDVSTIQSHSMQNSKYEMLSGYLDGELTQQEAQKVMLLLDSDESYRQLHDEMAIMRQEVQSLSLQDNELEHLDRLFQEPVAKNSRLFGFALLAISSVIIVAMVMYFVFMNAAISLLLKCAIAGLGFGALLLLFSVLRQRITVSRGEKYKRINL
jgi:hypothetical protein